MLVSKRCVVFAVETPNTNERRQCVDFYVFDEDFIPVENVEGKSLDDEACRYSIIKDSSQIARPYSFNNHCHTFRSYASLGGRVYCAGGCTNRCEECKPLPKFDCASKLVDCWDAINNCWTILPEMNLGRESKWFVLHVFQDKLYAIGGTSSNDKFVFIERLDESEGCWTPLLHPPPTVKVDCDAFVSAAIESKGFILFGSRACDSFYAFTPPQTWTPIHLPLNPSTLFSRPLYSLTVVDSHLLWLDACQGYIVIGCHVDTGNYFEIDLASEGLLPRDERRYYFPRLIYVANGVLALVWSDDSYHALEGEEDVHDHDAFCSFHCIRFSVDFVSAHAGEKCCKLVSHHRCIGPKIFDRLVAAFAVDMAVPVGSPSNSNSDSMMSESSMISTEAEFDL